jgi:hypothetical protein
MSRNPQLEAVFEARFAWENATRSECGPLLKEYHRLLDEALVNAKVEAASRKDLEDALVEAYREFRHAKRQEERVRLSRIR